MPLEIFSNTNELKWILQLISILLQNHISYFEYSKFWTAPVTFTSLPNQVSFS